jgi:2-phospho-L-lactate/phosphoenolpyruvate guanylyltransferase
MTTNEKPASDGSGRRKLCVVVPVKVTTEAKQRLAPLLSASQRRTLALTMLEDVLASLVHVAGLADIMVVTADPAAGAIAGRYGAQVWSDGAHAGHTGAVAAAARRLASARLDMLTLPGDIPLVEPEDIRELVAATEPFVIVPARDDLGSNAVRCAPAEIVPLRFGDNSFFPHLDAARQRGIAPKVVRLPRIALDIDTRRDLALFLAQPSRTRTRALLDGWHIRGDQETEALA